MDIPKFIGVVYVPDFETGETTIDNTEYGNDEAVVTSETLKKYNEAVTFYRAAAEPESFIEQIGWDVYKSTRASANSKA